LVKDCISADLSMKLGSSMRLRLCPRKWLEIMSPCAI
jgi:hypothetical protein